MTLRTRVLAGVVVIAVALAAGLGVLVARQRAAEIAVIDERLERDRDLVPGAESPRSGAGTLAGAFVGTIAEDGTITPINPLAADPTAVPRLTLPVEVTGGPSTVATSSTAVPRMRVVSLTRGGGLLVIGYPLDEIDARNRALTGDAALLYGLVCVVLAAVTWQVLRLGVRPLALMARYADAVSVGDESVPSPDFASGTEADRLARAFRTTIDAKDRAVGGLEAFVADTSHELLNPLSTITGYAQLYLAGRITDPAATHDVVARIDQEARRIGRAVEGLAQLSLTRTMPVGTARDVDVSLLVADLCLDLTLIHPDRPVRVDIDPALVVAGDPDLVVQVVGALLRNALEHTAATVPLTVAVHPASGLGGVAAVRIEVTDEGPGIAAHHQALLFERFYRVDPSTGSSPVGLGLGLAIVASITAAMNGRCGVTSGPGGSTFWLEFPRVVHVDH